MDWIKTSDKLPDELSTSFDEDGDIDVEKPYLGVFFSFDEYEGEETLDEEPDNMDIVYYYGDNHWKNNRWETVYVKYWLEIPPLK